MPKWSLKSKLLQVRLVTVASLVLCLITLIQLLGFYGKGNYPHVPREALQSELYVATNLDYDSKKPNCTYDHILQSDKSIHSWDVPTKYNDFSAEGIAEGAFAPPRCNAQISVALLVPYRNRQRQLDIFLPYMHNFLRKQNIHYKIFLIEQQDNKPWNKGILYNIGARQAMREKFPCLILHDVDLLPLNEANLYACLHQPRHMSASIDKFRFVLPYERLVGGVLALRAAHYARLDGFSNRFYGWGGEDDDLAERIVAKGLQIQRFPPAMSEYTMLVHEQEAKNVDRGRIMAENRAGLREGAGAGSAGGAGAAGGGEGLRSVRYADARRRPQRLVTLIGVTL